MGIDVSWDTQTPNLLRWDFYDTWTLEDFWDVVAKSHDMVEEIDGTFDMLLNGNNTPTPALPMATFQRAFRQASPKQNIVVIVNENPLVRSLIQVLQRLRIPKTEKVFFVRSVDEGLALITNKRRAHV